MGVAFGNLEAMLGELARPDLGAARLNPTVLAVLLDEIQEFFPLVRCYDMTKTAWPVIQA